MLEVAPSDRESRRFGVSIGRLVVSAGQDPVELPPSIEDFDVVIVRHDAADRRLPALLALHESHVAIVADVLVYWVGPTDRPSARHDEYDQYVVGPSGDWATLEPLIRSTFDAYTNHYAANPLLDASLTLDGYCEWAQDLLASESGSCLVLRDRGDQLLGFAIVDRSGWRPDIKLAGIRSGHRGAGLYRLVIDGVLDAAAALGEPEVEISTQVDNTRVTRAWARLGLLPDRAQITTHLVRRDRLAASAVGAFAGR